MVVVEAEEAGVEVGEEAEEVLEEEKVKFWVGHRIVLDRHIATTRLPVAVEAAEEGALTTAMCRLIMPRSTARNTTSWTVSPPTFGS